MLGNTLSEPGSSGDGFLATFAVICADGMLQNCKEDNITELLSREVEFTLYCIRNMFMYFNKVHLPSS